MTPVVGRSHGIHAEPTTFGLKMAIWYEEIGRGIERLKSARKRIAVGQVSGAVGVFAGDRSRGGSLGVLKNWGLQPSPVSSQVIQRDRHAEFFSALALLASSIDKFAVEVRHMQRTEVLEAEEFFSKGAEGIFCNAAQAQSGCFRTDVRIGTCGAGKRHGGNGKHAALARARYQPFLR